MFIICNRCRQYRFLRIACVMEKEKEYQQMKLRRTKEVAAFLAGFVLTFASATVISHTFAGGKSPKKEREVSGEIPIKEESESTEKVVEKKVTSNDKASFAHGEMYLTEFWYGDTGIGMNENGTPISQAVNIEFDYQGESLPDDLKIDTSWGATFNMAKAIGFGDNGDYSTTRYEFFTSVDDNNREKLGMCVLLPDDPSLEGAQWIKVTLGDSFLNVPFGIEYVGDYKTGTGWKQLWGERFFFND